MIKKILLFWNPGAGGVTTAKVDHAIAKLIEAGFDVCNVHTEARRPTDGPCQGYIEKLDGHDAVLIAGGDGTISNVLNGLGDHLRVPFGIIPLGTVNLLSRELGVTFGNFEQAVTKGQKQQVHLADMNDLRVAMTASVGFDAKSVARLNVELKKKIGVLAYIVSLLKTIGSCRLDSYQVICDGQAHIAKSVIVMNGQYYGGSYRLGYKTGISKPDFQIYLLGKNDFWSILRYCTALVFGRLHRSADVEVVEATHVRIETEDADCPVQGDGDVYLRLPVDIRSHHHHYDVLVP
jgi:YegS/Rv2252/BmrU family lipid kinase